MASSPENNAASSPVAAVTAPTGTVGRYRVGHHLPRHVYDQTRQDQWGDVEVAFVLDPAFGPVLVDALNATQPPPPDADAEWLRSERFAEFREALGRARSVTMFAMSTRGLTATDVYYIWSIIQRGMGPGPAGSA